MCFRPIAGVNLRESDTCGIFCTILMCFVPVARAMKALRRFEMLELLMHAWRKAAEGLPVCLFFLLVATLLFASMIFIVEPRDNIPSLPKAIWLTIVTMTTVGYGDVTPVGTAGSCIVSVLVVFSVLYMAMPLGIVGNAFTEVWQERDFILLRNRVKHKLEQMGFGPYDLPQVFSLFVPTDGDGQMQLEDFQKMMSELRLGLAPRRVTDLFDAIDVDRGGSIDDQEFVKTLFPHYYHAIYDQKEADEADRDSQGRSDD